MAPFVDWVKSWLDLEEKKSEMNEKQDTVDQNPPRLNLYFDSPEGLAINRPIRHIYLTIL